MHLLACLHPVGVRNSVLQRAGALLKAALGTKGKGVYVTSIKE